MRGALDLVNSDLCWRACMCVSVSLCKCACVFVYLSTIRLSVYYARLAISLKACFKLDLSPRKRALWRVRPNAGSYRTSCNLMSLSRGLVSDPGHQSSEVNVRTTDRKCWIKRRKQTAGQSGEDRSAPHPAC